MTTFYKLGIKFFGEELLHVNQWETSARFRIRAKVKSFQADMELRKMYRLADAIFTRRCDCEHDCCTCINTLVCKIYKVKRREWAIEYLNYKNI